MPADNAKETEKEEAESQEPEEMVSSELDESTHE